MMILGVILAMLGLVLSFPVLWIIGLVLIVAERISASRERSAVVWRSTALLLSHSFTNAAAVHSL